MLVLGTCAYPGSGQDVFATELGKRLGVEVYSMGDAVRRLVSEKGLPGTRANLQQIRRELNENHDKGYLAERMAQDILRANKPAIVTGIRLREEVTSFRMFLNLRLVFVWAEPETRLSRLLRRGEEKDTRDPQQLAVQLENEAKLFDISYLKTISDAVIDCDMSLNSFLSGFDNTLLQLGSIYDEMALAAKEARDENK